jgi:hypothetical protein
MLKLRDRKWFAENETRIGMRSGRRVLLTPNHRIIVAEIDRASNRFDLNDPGTKSVNRRYLRQP